MAFSSFRRQSFSLQGGEMAGVAFGPSGPPDMVFLHANGFNALTYRSLFEPLASQGVGVLAVDQRGHGRTSLAVPATQRQDWSDLKDDLVALFEVLGLQRPAVVAGHSLGGTAALLAAPLLKDRVKALVLLDPVIRARGAPPADLTALVEGARRRRRAFDSREQALAAYEGRGAFSTWPKDALADYLTDGLEGVPGGLRLSCAPEWEANNFAAQGSDPWSALDRLEAPLTILRAERGSTCRIDPAEPQIAKATRRQMLTIEGTSHFLPMERPDIAAAAILRALDA